MIIYLGGGYGSHMCRTEPEVVTPTVPDLSPVLPYRVPRDLGFLTLSFPSPGAPTVPGELVHPPQLQLNRPLLPESYLPLFVFS